MKRLLKIILVNLSILLSLFLIMELVFRILGFGYGNAPLENDGTLHHVHPKNYSYACYDPSEEYGGHTVQYDRNRRRINTSKPKNKKSKSIWFLGDSFTEATQLDWGNTFVGLVEEKSDYRILNYGVASYSPLLYYIQLKEELKSATPKPDMVFVQLYSNDIRDDDKYASSTEFDEHDRPVSCNGGKPNRLKKLIRKSYVARVARRAYLTMIYVKNQKKNTDTKGTVRTEDFVEDAPNITDDSRFAKSIIQIDSLLNEQEIEHYFFAIPSKYACFTGKWDTKTFSANFSGFMERKELPIIDLDPSFEEASKSDTLFYAKDIHCNENGNRIIGSKLLNYINK